MTDALPTVHLKNAWRSNHPWIFQKLVEKPAQRPKPGSIVDIVGVDGAWIGRGFYNGHSRIALRILETDPDVAVDAAWFAAIIDAVRLRRDVLKLDDTSNACRVVHSEGDGLSGLVVDRYDDLLVVEFFSAGMFRHREWIYAALREHFPGCRFHSFADEHVQKQESFDLRQTTGTAPANIVEHGIRFRADPAGAHKTGFFADQRDNREWLAPAAQASACSTCAATPAVSACMRRCAVPVKVGIDIDEAVLDIARGNAKLNNVRPRFVQADIFRGCAIAANGGERFDVVILDPAKMTRDRDQVINALKKYLDMNKLALGVVKPGGLFATFSCTGLGAERGTVPRHAAPRRVLRRAHGAGAEGRRRRRRPSLLRARAGVALPEGGVLPRARLNRPPARRVPRRTRRAMVAVAALVALALAITFVLEPLREWLRPAPVLSPTSFDWNARIEAVAGDGHRGLRDGHLLQARFDEPWGLVRGSDGALYVSEGGSGNRIRRIAADGMVSTFAGGGSRDSPTASAPRPRSTRLRRWRSTCSATSMSPTPATTRSARCRRRAW